MKLQVVRWKRRKMEVEEMKEKEEEEEEKEGRKEGRYRLEDVNIRHMKKSESRVSSVEYVTVSCHEILMDEDLEQYGDFENMELFYRILSLITYEGDGTTVHRVLTKMIYHYKLSINSK
jgi:hypothetical protein